MSLFKNHLEILDYEPYKRSHFIFVMVTGIQCVLMVMDFFIFFLKSKCRIQVHGEEGIREVHHGDLSKMHPFSNLELYVIYEKWIMKRDSVSRVCIAQIWKFHLSRVLTTFLFFIYNLELFWGNVIRFVSLYYTVLLPRYTELIWCVKL